MRHRIRPAGSVEVALFPLDLSGDVADLRRQTRVFAQSVWSEAAHPGSWPYDTAQWVAASRLRLLVRRGDMWGMKSGHNWVATTQAVEEYLVRDQDQD